MQLQKIQEKDFGEGGVGGSLGGGCKRFVPLACMHVNYIHAEALTNAITVRQIDLWTNLRFTKIMIRQMTFLLNLRFAE